MKYIYIYITSDPLWLVYSAKPQKRKKKKKKKKPPKNDHRESFWFTGMARRWWFSCVS